MKTALAQQQDGDFTVAYREYYGQLIGAQIKQVVLIGDPWGHAVPVLIVQTADKREMQVEVWCDPEGNGAGHLDIHDPLCQ